MDFHEDPLVRDQWIADYLLRRMDPERLEEFEAHYLECGGCFDELRAADLLVAGLQRSTLQHRRIGDIALISFSWPVELLHSSVALNDLARNILEQSDTKVLIDLSRVSRIDSAGLGQLLRFHAHLINRSGSMTLLKPNPSVTRLLNVTRIDSVLPVHDDEQEALRSLSPPSRA